MASSAVLRPYASLIVFTFACFFCAGMPLALIPGFVHDELGYGVVIAGGAVSLQYLATLFSRAYGGRLSDRRGPKLAIVVGMLLCACSGLFVAICGLIEHSPTMSLAALVVSRLLIGASTSLASTAVLVWAMAIARPEQIAGIFSWNGIAGYLGLALGAPAGLLLMRHLGWSSVGGVTIAVGLVSALAIVRRPAIEPVVATRLALSRVLVKMLPFGVCLTLGSFGFGGIVAFVTLYYGSMHWNNAALTLAGMGASLVLARLVLAQSIPRLGGYHVTVLSLGGQVLGLLMLWLAPTEGLAMLGVGITGFATSLVFPALGVEAVKQVSANNRGSALGSYTAFLDIALFVSGPIAGAIAARHGYPSIFLAAALAALAGCVGVLVLRRSPHLVA